MHSDETEKLMSHGRRLMQSRALDERVDGVFWIALAEFHIAKTISGRAYLSEFEYIAQFLAANGDSGRFPKDAVTVLRKYYPKPWRQKMKPGSTSYDPKLMPPG